MGKRIVIGPVLALGPASPITVTRAELDWARRHPLGLFDRMLLDAIDAARARHTP